jgi:Tol biopolymer transport system component
MPNLEDRDKTFEWLNTAREEHNLISGDGKTLYFLMTTGQSQDRELWEKDLASENIERLLPGHAMDSYSVSRDGKSVVFAMNCAPVQFPPFRAR